MEMTSLQLQYAIANLANLLRSGLHPSEALREMQYVQPKFAEYWQQAGHKAANGHSLASILRPILDDAMHSAINAAELSGTVVVVLTRLEKAMVEKRAIKKTLNSMYYPFSMLFGALAVFTLYIAFVVPNLSKGLPRKPGTKESTLEVVGNAANQFLTQYWLHLSIVVVLSIVAAVLWLREPENRDTALAILDGIPVLGPAARDLFYGEWATHMAINTHAGITVLEAIDLTHTILPGYYRAEIHSVAKDITRLGQAEAAARRPNADIRNNIPFLVVNAFRLSDRTGITDTNFQSAAEALITQGKQRIEMFVTTTNNILTPLTAILGASAMLPYFAQIGSTISNVR